MTNVDVSVIIPIYNGEKWIDECFGAIASSDFAGSLEISIFNDASTDGTLRLLSEWRPKFERESIRVVVGGQLENEKDAALLPPRKPGGVGRAKNLAVAQSCGNFLCFQDVDDVMSVDRIRRQFDAASRLSSSNCIVGSRFRRIPESSTRRFTEWACRLSDEQLRTQIYTANGPTVLMPTWFVSRRVFDVVGGFDETGKGCPEDYIFFLEHLRLGGRVHRCDEVLLTYRYHENCETFSVDENTIWDLRMKYFQEDVLIEKPWDDGFTIWNAGKQGRKFYRSLTDGNRKKVVAFCDVDVKKLTLGHYTYEEAKERPKPKIPIIHFSIAKPPIVICVKQNLTQGAFENNLASLNLSEGKDFFFFS